jgi:lauroyl/myristoyl acyltransferase
LTLVGGAHYPHRVIYWLHRLGSVIASIVPRAVAYQLVEWLTPPALVLFGRQKRNALRNMRRQLGPAREWKDAQRIVDRVFVNYGKYMVDVLRLPSLSPSSLSRQVVVYGLENIDQAFADGNGLIVVTAHVGNWDLAGATLAAMGYPVNAIVDTLEPPRWNEEVQAIRHRLGINPVPLEGGPREMLAALRRNEILGILIDRPLTEEGVAVQFFGTETRVPAGAATLALRTGAGVVTAVVVRESTYYVAHVGPLLRPESTGDRAADVRALTQRFMDQLEVWIRRYPDQWYMFRDMWPARGQGPGVRVPGTDD